MPLYGTIPSSTTAQPPLLAPPLCQHTCIDVPRATVAAADGNGCNNAANIDGGHPPAPSVGNNDTVASIRTTAPCPDKAPPPSSFVDVHPPRGFTLICRQTQWRLPLCCSARKPGTILSFSKYSRLWWRVERWRNTTINRSWGLRVGLRQTAATKALSLANGNHQRPLSPWRNTHSSDRERSNGGGSESLAPLSNCCSCSTTPTPSMDGSAHSLATSGCQGKCINYGPSILKMIDKKRDARTMLERVVYIKVCTIKLPVPLTSFWFQCIDALKTRTLPFCCSHSKISC